MNDSIGIIGGADGPAAAAITGSIAGVFFAVFFLLLFFALAIGVVCYVLQGLGMYTIAQRRGLKHAWAAWVPVANYWLLGSIADQYLYVAKGKIKNYRKILLCLVIAFIAAYIAFECSAVAGILGGNAAAILGWFFSGLAMFALAIALLVFYYIALYNLYQSCQPSNAVLYLVLSVLVPVTVPFFVFFSRKKDLGMPPRKQPAEAQILEEAPVQEEVEEIAEEPKIVEENTEEPVEE